MHLKGLQASDSKKFADAVRLFESKNYAGAMKIAKELHAKHPDHAECVALLGFLTYYNDDKEEGFKMVRSALRFDIKSALSWQLLGMMHRNDNNLLEALKCYMQFLKFDPENLPGLREYAMLQSQLHQWNKLSDTRNKLLQLKPELISNWTSFAIALDLKGDPKTACKVLTAYEESILDQQDRMCVDYSELILYHAYLLIFELHEPSDGYKLLRENSKYIKDKALALEMKAQACSESEKLRPLAKTLYKQLINEVNPNCEHYFMKLIENEPDRLEVLMDFWKSHQSDLVLPVLLLNEASSTGTAENLDIVCKDVLDYFFDKQLGTIFEVISKSLENPKIRNACLEYAQKVHSEKELKCSALFLAHIYFQERKMANALDLIQNLDCSESFYLQLRIYEYLGMYDEGLQCIQNLRQKYPNDRSICTQEVLMKIELGLFDDAFKSASDFTRKSNEGPLRDWAEMQNKTILLTLCRGYRKKKYYGYALDVLERLKKIYQEYFHEPIDFNVYCFTKGTIGSYKDILNWHQRFYTNEKNRYLDFVHEAYAIYMDLDADSSLLNADFPKICWFDTQEEEVPVDGLENLKINAENGTIKTDTKAAAAAEEEDKAVDPTKNEKVSLKEQMKCSEDYKDSARNFAQSFEFKKLIDIIVPVLDEINRLGLEEMRYLPGSNKQSICQFLVEAYSIYQKVPNSKKILSDICAKALQLDPNYLPFWALLKNEGKDLPNYSASKGNMEMTLKLLESTKYLDLQEMAMNKILDQVDTASSDEYILSYGQHQRCLNFADKGFLSRVTGKWRLLSENPSLNKN